MPRDSNGIFSLPSGTLVNTGDYVLPSQHNPAMQDIAQALTNSMTRNGSGSMTGDLPMNNNRITGLAAAVNPNDAVTLGQLSGLGIPLGVPVDFWGTNPPVDWMFAYGQELDRVEYADLFAVIGTNAGAGNGSTTFNVPDYRDVVSVGRGNMGGTARGLLSNFASTVLGAVFGTQSHALTTAQLAAHGHTGTTSSVGDHTHPTLGTNAASNGLAEVASTYFGGGNIQQSPNNNRYTGGGGAHTHSLTINNSGSGESHPNVQPTIVCNKILRVK